jgi:hypothetical protein
MQLTTGIFILWTPHNNECTKRHWNKIHSGTCSFTTQLLCTAWVQIVTRQPKSENFNPLTPELNPSAQRWLPRFLLKILNCNSLNAQLNSICHLLELLGAHHILHVSRISIKGLTVGRLYKSLGVKGLISWGNYNWPTDKLLRQIFPMLVSVTWEME